MYSEVLARILLPVGIQVNFLLPTLPNKIQYSPFSIFRRFRLLHILTVQTLRIMAATKNRTLPTTPAVMARGPLMPSGPEITESNNKTREES